MKIVKGLEDFYPMKIVKGLEDFYLEDLKAALKDVETELDKVNKHLPSKA
jgi:hypothetical protein